MTFPGPKVGDNVYSIRDILASNNSHVTILSNSGPVMLPKGTHAEITAVSATHVEIICSDGRSAASLISGLKMKVAKVIWGISFSKSGGW